MHLLIRAADRFVLSIANTFPATITLRIRANLRAAKELEVRNRERVREVDLLMTPLTATARH